MKPDLEPHEESGSDSPSAPAWVVSFADMMSLLLVFFVLILSFSEIDAVKYRSLTVSLREAFGAQRVKDVFTTPTESQVVAQNTAGADGQLLEELRSIIPQAFPGALPNRKESHGYLLRVPGRLLFDTGKDELKPEMKPLLKDMAGLLRRRTEVTLRVDGHTDDVPISTPRFQSNWELSAARALAVIHFLVNEGGIPEDRLSAAAFGESRPLEPNDGEENREKNRRVEFRFVEDSEDESYEISYPSPADSIYFAR
jgi:chemotaxis protein MotB